MKVTDIFKVIITTLLVIAFTVSVISCKEASVVEEQVVEQQEEEKGEVTIPSETKETTPETTEETPPVVEEKPEKIEWEEVIISPIEGLGFDNGKFLFLEGNLYGGEVGTEAGVLTWAEINNEKRLVIGLGPPVVEAMQKKIMEEEKKFVYAIPIDLEKNKGIKIKEVEDKRTDDWTKKDGVFWDKNFNLEISNVPLGTIIYSPVSTSPDGYLFFGNNDRRNDYYHLGFLTNSREKLFRGNERVDAEVAVSIDAIGIKLLPEGIEEKMVQDEGSPFPLYRSDVKMGTPVAEIISKEYLNDQYWDKNISPSEPASEPSILIHCEITQSKDPDKPFDIDQMSKYLIMGLEGLLKLGEEEMFVFISPAYK